MPRFYLRLTVLPLLLFTAALLIHAQPYDDHELRQLLLPDGCPAPCFMGIRPGVTTMDEAVRILEASRWVAKIEKVEFQTSDPIIKITWNSSGSIWLKNDSYGDSSVWIKRGLVATFKVNTNIELGTIQLSLGEPSFQHLTKDSIGGHLFLNYAALYPDIGMFTDISITCYLDEEKKHITYKDDVVLSYTQVPNITPQLFKNSWTDVLKMKC